MSACSWRPRLLDAELEELRAGSGSALAGHMAGCPECAAAAGRLLEAHYGLDTHLSTHPPLDAAALVAQAREASARGAPLTVGKQDVGRAGPSRGRRWTGRTVWAPILAAAALAGLLLLPRAERPLPPYGVVSALAPPDVSEPAGQDFAVLRTDDPDITVVWIFQGENGR